jgi:hypothetical protein
VKGKENPYLLAMKRAVILLLCALMGRSSPFLQGVGVVVTDLDQAILPDHPVWMECILEHLPDDRGPVLASTVLYPGRL